MNGFSGSATFSGRFAFLYPARVNALTAGGSGGHPLPQKSIDGTTLRYPLGTADYATITGRDFDLEQWTEISQYIYVGQEDQPHPDTERVGYYGISHRDREKAETVYGMNRVTERIPFLEAEYNAAGADATFQVYEGIGHTITNGIIDDVVGVHRNTSDAPHAMFNMTAQRSNTDQLTAGDAVTVVVEMESRVSRTATFPATLTVRSDDTRKITDMSIAQLDGFTVVLYGYWAVPETTTPEAAREAHEIEAEAILYEMAAEFSHAGAATDTQLHFGPADADQGALQQRIIEDTAADGVLLATELRSVTNVLVPLRDDRHGEQVIEFLAAFDTDSIFVLELYHVAADEDAIATGESLLESVAETLLSRGFSEGNLELSIEVATDAQSAIAERARNHNIVVLGETEQDGFEDRLFGPTANYIADESETPTIVIR